MEGNFVIARLKWDYHPSSAFKVKSQTPILIIFETVASRILARFPPNRLPQLIVVYNVCKASGNYLVKLFNGIMRPACTSISDPGHFDKITSLPQSMLFLVVLYFLHLLPQGEWGHTENSHFIIIYEKCKLWQEKLSRLRRNLKHWRDIRRNMKLLWTICVEMLDQEKIAYIHDVFKK